MPLKLQRTRAATLARVNSFSLHSPTVPGASVDALLATAQRLQHAADSGAPERPLRGKFIALLCDADNEAAALAFEQAAMALGAVVSRLAPGALSAPGAARLLSRLYAAVACEGDCSALAPQIASEADVPVFHGLVQALRPLAAHTAWPPGLAVQRLVQAVLVLGLA